MGNRYKNSITDTLVNVAGLAPGTYYYYLDFYNVTDVAIQVAASTGATTGTTTVTFEGTLQDDGTVKENCVYVDFGSGMFGTATLDNSAGVIASIVVSKQTPHLFRYMRIKAVVAAYGNPSLRIDFKKITG